MVGPMCTMVLSLPIVEPTKSPTIDLSKREPPGQWTSYLGQSTPWLGLLNLLNQLETLTSSFSFSDGLSPRAMTSPTKRVLTLIGRCHHLSSFLCLVINGQAYVCIFRQDTLNLLQHKLFLSVGHDEYWSGPQRAKVTDQNILNLILVDKVEEARDQGLSLAFFSGNEVYWRVRWAKSWKNNPR